MSSAQVLSELRQIKERLNPDPRPAYIDRDVLSKAAAVAAFARRVDGGLEVDGKDFSQYIIQSDGNIGDVSYRVKNLRGDWTTEFEASRLPYVPGPVELIQFKNDVAESGKSIFVTKMKVPNLSAAPPPIPAEEVDPHIIVGGNVEIPYVIGKKTTPVFKTLFIFIGTTNVVGTFESPGGTDYSVPASKELIIYRYIYNSSVAGVYFGLGYGDDGVAAGGSDPTNPVWVLGADNVPTLQTPTADKNEIVDLDVRIPADKFPFAEVQATNANKLAVILGVEVDA